MMKSVQEIAHSLYFSFVCYASSTNDIWHYPQHRIFTFYKNGLAVSSVGRASIAREGHRFDSCAVNSTQKTFDFCIHVLHASFLKVQSRLLVYW